MADTSLDDFFAKKDKTKKKGKSKVTPNELMEKQKIKKKKVPSEKKEESDEQIQVDTSKGKGIEDEEWLDVQEEEKDYTGLRIQTLQITQEKEDEDKESDQKLTDDEDGEFSEKKDGGVSGPWAKMDAAAPPPVQKPPTPEPEPKEEAGPTKPAKYVPPGARQAAQSQGIGPGMGSSRRGKKTAPNLQSEEDFPTLGGEAPPVTENPWGAPGSRFEKVKSGGKMLDESSSNKGPQLSLGNKYTALQGGTE